ncbi:hypothetical protein [Bradyrhizobium sp. URHD0069]|uniref:hypothetical protein n=1 Tax=Bradyrhizobium sp. URHD0069 TaxID=1380355 RepID=UPI0006914CEC|nr:hypothetical protein [Bradyrhizobium sp. URHD0069]
MFRADNFDQDSGESRHGNVDQIANRKLRGLEVDADRRADFQVDEQEKDVLDPGAACAAMSKNMAAADQTVVAPITNSARS